MLSSHCKTCNDVPYIPDTANLRLLSLLFKLVYSISLSLAFLIQSDKLCLLLGVFKPFVFSPGFTEILLTHIVCEFKVYNVIKYVYTLQNDYHGKES